MQRPKIAAPCAAVGFFGAQSSSARTTAASPSSYLSFACGVCTLPPLLCPLSAAPSPRRLFDLGSGCSQHESRSIGVCGRRCCGGQREHPLGTDGHGSKQQHESDSYISLARTVASCPFWVRPAQEASKEIPLASATVYLATAPSMHGLTLRPCCCHPYIHHITQGTPVGYPQERSPAA